MKKILNLCINLLFFIISDAVSLKLIAGNRSVVKKDGATHTISKYYVVPNDFDSINVTNSTEASQATLRMNSLYSKSMDADTTSEASERQVSEQRVVATNDQTNANNSVVNDTTVNLRSSLNDTQARVATQANNNTAITVRSVNTEQSLDPDDLGNIQVEPITNSMTINSSVPINEINVYNSSEALQNGTSIIVKNVTQTFEKDVEDGLRKFGIAVQESSVQNQESFWKLVKLTVDRISDDDELLAKIEKLSLLLNIFTNLYGAAKLQKPIESMIDNIIDILQIPFVEKSNKNESQSEINVSGDYDEECLRKCGQKHSKNQLDSNSINLSETESLEASDNLGLENLNLQRRNKGDSDDGDDRVNTSNDSVSNQVTVSNQPTNILQTQLSVPNNLNLGLPDGFSVSSSVSTPTLNHVSHDNDVQEDPKSNQTIPALAALDKNLDDQPLTVESRLTDLPWHIEDKIIDHQPWIIEHTLPIEDQETKKVHSNVENKIGHSPTKLNQSNDPSVIQPHIHTLAHHLKVLLESYPPMTGTVHSVKNRVKKPYHIYTYVINPAISLYEIPNSGNIVNVKSRQTNANLGTNIYDLSTSHGGNKIVYTNKSSPSYYESQFSLSKPTVDMSQLLKHTNDITATFDAFNEVNSSDLLSGTTQDVNQPKNLVGHEPETNNKPALIQPNTHSSNSQTNSNKENDAPIVSEADSHPEVLLPTVPSNSFESLINRGKTGPVFTTSSSASASASVSADTSNVNPDTGDTKPNSYKPNINLNLMQQTDLQPRLISKASYYSEHTNSPDEYDEPSPVYSGHTDKRPGLVSTSSSSSAYTNLPDEYNEPVYGGQTHQRPDLISSSASSNSEYTNLPDGYDEPSPVYDGLTYKHPGFISTSSSSSAYTNLPDEYNEPVYGGQTHQRPDLISSSASSNSEYTNLPDGYDEPSPVYDGLTYKHPGFISTSSSSSAYTNLPDEYNEPVYGGQTHQRPDLISSSASSNSEYTNLPDGYDEPSPVYDGLTYKHPGFISTSSSSSAYTNLPNEYDEPVYGGQTHQRPDLISSSASSNSEYTNLPDGYDEPSPVYDGLTYKHPGFISTSSSSSAYTNLPDEYNEPVYGGQTHQRPDLISSSASSNSEYTNLPDGYDEPSPVYDGLTYKHPGFISTSSSSSAYTNLPNEYDEPVYGGQTHQRPDLISSSWASSNSEYTNSPDDYDEPSPVYNGKTYKYPGLISDASAHSDYTNIPNDYNNPVPNYGQDTDRNPGPTSDTHHYPEYANVVDDYDEPIPVYGGQIHKYPGFISEASSYSDSFTNVPNDYNNPSPDYEEDTDRYPVNKKTPANGSPRDIKDNLLVPDYPNRHTVHIIQPSLIAYLHGIQPTGFNYLKHLKLKLAPTYRLFTLDNLLKLHDVVMKTIEVNSDEPAVYDNIALMKLRKIINLILIVAEHLQDSEGSIKWYEKIFYNTQKNRHPLEIYVYNLIRQRWLHELMLVLYKNGFNFNILQNPRIFSFLGSWQFPNYVRNFMEAEELKQHNFDFNAPKVFDQIFSTQHNLQGKFSTHTYDDVLEEVPEDLENYVTNHVIASYKPNAGIVLSIAGVEAEPDANAIIQIIQKYLNYKGLIEKQENVIIPDNKVEMLNQIILFLREKGYGVNTIADLISKLYTAVYSTESKGCQAHHPNFSKNIYDVIFPVLRRSGR